ncbi:MAG: bifunctional precorrin-2 dehydrogenase/sirohydrochlorin ferrochelatase [Desulfobacterales bacterium]|nr:bifunctional precorrin-2 dehydrogenase/sirohydrochlorin ferrochelatase [Desulfobacterales bacterium]
MRYYPVQLDIRGRACLVVGGGAVGTRKAETLAACGGRVTVVSPEATAALQQMAAEGRVALALRNYNETDLEGIFLVIGATDDEALNRRISADAEARRILCNIADRPEICNFILPSILRRGDLVITFSTSGQSPAFAKKLRQRLEAQFGEEYGVFLEVMGAIRRRLIARQQTPEAHKHLFEALIESDLLELIRTGRRDEADVLLERFLGSGFRIQDLLNPNRTPSP